MKKEILYPRSPASIFISQIKDEAKIIKKIKKIEDGKIFLKYKTLQEKLLQIERDKPTFKCGKCATEEKLKNLTLYRFITYVRNADEDIYEDDNIICPKCGCFNCVRVKPGLSDDMFGKVEKVDEN